MRHEKAGILRCILNTPPTHVVPYSFEAANLPRSKRPCTVSGLLPVVQVEVVDVLGKVISAHHSLLAL